MMRSARFLLGLALGFALAIAEARAEQVVIVLDRGEAAKPDADEHERAARTLLAAHEAETPRLVLYGTRPDGRTRSGVLSRGFEKALDQSRSKEGWRYDGPTDIRKALDLARGRSQGDEPLLVYLIGPFAGPPLEAEEGRAFLDTWEDDAPPGSRVLPLFALAPARELLDGTTGVQGRGWILVGHGDPEVETLPYAPLENGARLEARVRLPLELLGIGQADGILPLEATSDRTEDRLDVDARADGLHVHLRRDELAHDRATLTFELPERPDVVVLADAPPPVDLTWEERLPGARIEETGEGDAPPPYEALDVVGEAAPYRLSLLVADAGEDSTWTLSGDGEDLPPGMRVRVAAEATERPHVRRHVFEVTFAYPGVPVDASGRFILVGTGHDETFSVPYRLTTAPARIHVRREGDEATRKLPLDDDDEPFTWLVEHLAGNVPAKVRLSADLQDDALAERLVLDVQRGEASDPVSMHHADVLTLEGPELPVRLLVRPRLVEAALPLDGALRFTLLEDAGVIGASDGAGRVAARRPRLVLEQDAEPSYVLSDGAVEARRPWTLRVDPDGGPASWRGALNAAAPTLQVPDDAPTAWRLDGVGEGRWALVPTGPWTGARADTFAGRDEVLPLGLAWPRGPVPGAIRVPVFVKPRWGPAGWILVGLAAIALVIGGIALSHLRSPAIHGTLLYAVEGKEGAVGRLDLAVVGRGSAPLRVDEAGRLHLSGKGPRLGRIRASRLGGMLDLDVEGGTPSRHLLVDGLALETSSHRLRYVSSHPEDSRVDFVPEPVPDLLGPEFDLEGGRIRALEGPSPEPKDPLTREGEAGEPDARS